MNRFAPRLRDFPHFFLFAVALLLYVGSSQAQVPTPATITSEQATLHIETNLVVLPVRVTGPDGNFIDGLTREQFRVRENGRPQPITLFEREDTPVTLGLIVDHSRSMGPKLSGVAEAVAAFARSSNPNDEMFVVDFGDNVVVELPGGRPFTSDPRDLQQAITAVEARGMTALYDAIAEGFNHVQAGRWDKKALIVVSDGGDNASGRKYADVLELARRHKP
jgi:VWFA-related protein